MGLSLLPVALALSLFALVLLALELGHRLGGKRAAAGAPPASVGAVEGAVYALMGLVLAFSFSAAAARLDSRRGVILEEANAIGTAWLRVDLAEQAAREPLRGLFRRYLDARVRAHAALPDEAAYESERAVGNGLQAQIWTRAVDATRDKTTDRMLLLTALNAMIDSAGARTLAVHTHLPPLVLGFMLALVLLSSLLAGTSLSTGPGRSWLYRMIFAGVISSAVYVIVDLEHPRIGIIRVAEADALLVELRRTMSETKAMPSNPAR